MSEWQPDRMYSEHRDTHCKYCDEGWLHWEQDDNGKWKLCDDNGYRHICDDYRREEA